MICRMVENISDDAAEPEGTEKPNGEGFDLERAERIREVLKTGGGREQVAARIGVHPGSLTRYLKRRDLPTATLVAIADACGVSVEWLATGRGSKLGEWVNPRYHDTDPIGTVYEDGTAVAAGPVLPLPGGTPRQYVAIPRFNIQASAGGGALAEHAQVVEYLAFDLDFLRTRLRRDPKHLVLIETRGDSMEPTIRDGDILTVDIAPGQPLQHSQLYVVRVDDNLMVKRLELRLDGGLIVHSDNPRYAPETVVRADLDTLHILGRVLLVTTPPR